ncbi:TDT family transporter [Pseudovibrio exalbescens]|uniref:C4-dicarboxylate ABC transporter n=1 Tax=Pseudovibrio exalbescens TaxID=197461 RepID=A0A1U7JLJ3_9HYPH|nr:TDT family transporter [Pseudovibrio exalbescens]OKL45564.1 C4-dicarboxylate ABC transporter [Pseudovibrio exalbescens]
MTTKLKERLAFVPTPMAGLALGIASLGWSWENAGQFHGQMQMAGAAIGAALLLMIAIKFTIHPSRLMDDLRHPVVGSVVPTFAMATMVVSKSVASWSVTLGASLWLIAVVLHLGFLTAFVFHRAKVFRMAHMVPSWFVPPVGIIVANVAFPGVEALRPLANGLLVFGIVCYAIMLPIMMHRLIFHTKVPDAAKPTLAILAAPASLSLAGYLTMVQIPSPVIIAVLAGIAILMTMLIYMASGRLLKLSFTPAFAAYTFPLVIGATAMFKTANVMQGYGMSPEYVAQVRLVAHLELYVATVVVAYVAARYLWHYSPLHRIAPPYAPHHN